MKFITIDASVVIKWIFPERAHETHQSEALHLLHAIKKDMLTVVQPVHWLTETAAVMVRLQPETADEATNLLTAMEFSILDTPAIYHLAIQLAIRFNHHLFDTLYHAVALHHGNCKFITADEKYYQKAVTQGAITRLADFSVFSD